MSKVHAIYGDMAADAEIFVSIKMVFSAFLEQTCLLLDSLNFSPFPREAG